MKIFFVGDFVTQTGPGIANRNLKEGILLVKNSTDKICFSHAISKLARVIELRKILTSDYTVICSKSGLNYLAIKLAKIANKKIIYVMHGYSSYEAKINGDTSNQMEAAVAYENYVFKKVNKIICVSLRFKEYLQKDLPRFSEKFDYCYNGMQILKRMKHENPTKQILSVGGGEPRKCIIQVCEAISLLNERHHANLLFTVVGANHKDTSSIKKYEFVEYIEKVEHEQLLSLMADHELYIQNSEFETFGLAIMEALSCGCSLLISNQAGVIDLFSNIRESDVIYNNRDIEEIAKKIWDCLKEGNNDYLYSGLKSEDYELQATARKFLKKVGEVR